MKNVMHLLGLVLCLISTSTSAQIIKLPNQISAESGKNGEPGQLYLDSGCNFTQVARVYVANLDVIVGNPCGQFLDLPASLYPDLYLRCWINDIERTVPVVSFARVECDEMGGNSSLYEFVTWFHADFSEECENNPNSSIALDVWARLGMLEGENFVDYPMCTYSGTGDIFDCDYFGSSESGCGTVCDNYDMANEWLTPEDRYCGGCQPDYEGGPIGNDPTIPDGDGNPTFRKSANEFALSVSPNPFNNQIIINWQNTVADGSMRIMDTSGKVVKSWSSTSAGMLTWDTSNLPRGMYILEVRDGAETKFLKLIKS